MANQYVADDLVERDGGTVDTLRGELDRADLSRHLAFFDRSPQTQRTVASTVVKLRHSGSAVSQTDRLVLDTGSETQLRHCRGLGLWLATWIVENGHGTLDFPRSGDPQIRIELYHRLD